MTQIELPKYKCHKEVWALKIKEIDRGEDGSLVIEFVEKGYAPQFFDEAFDKRHNPQEGEYLVFYKDGYVSCSPAKAFEEGYSRI